MLNKPRDHVSIGQCLCLIFNVFYSVYLSELGYMTYLGDFHIAAAMVLFP